MALATDLPANLIKGSQTLVYSRIFLKLYAGYVVIILFCTAIVSLMVGRQMQQDSILDIDKNLESQAIMLQESIYPALASNQTDNLQQRILQLARNIDIRLTVIAEDGTVLADTDQNPTSMDNHRNRPELQQALEQGRGIVTRYSHTLSQTMRYLALPVGDDKLLSGFVRVAMPLSLIDKRLDHLRNVVILAASLTAIIALLVGVWIARSFAMPLRRMTNMAQKLSDGDYQQRLTIDRQDEMGDLAATLNQLALTAAQRMETITKDRNKLATILTGMVEGVIAVDETGHVIHMNEAAGRMIDAIPEVCFGKLLTDVISIDAIDDAIKQCLHTRGVVQSELKLSSPPRYFELYATALYEIVNRSTGAVIVLHDVTELRKLERVRRDFVVNASHELKTPVTAIHGLAETMLEDDNMEVDTRKNFLQKIRDQSLRLSELTTDLLALSRLESDGTEDFTSINLAEIITSCSDALQAEANEKGVTLNAMLPDNELIVIADAKLIRQLLDNLLQNAIKYTPAGGHISLRLTVDDKQAIMEVEDDGIGIDTTEQEGIFERFYRVDKAHSRTSGGTGLGLSIVRHIVKKHQGQVSVQSSLGHGSLFRVSLPLANS